MLIRCWASFYSFHEKNVTEKDANNNAVLDANGKPKKVKGLFLYPFIQLHCESRCHQLHEAHEANLRGMQILASRVNSGPGMQADPGPGSEHVTDAQQPECATVHRLAEAAQAVPNVAMSTLGQALLDVASTAAAATECDAAATCVMALGGTQAAASELGSGNSRRRPRPREPSPTAVASWLCPRPVGGVPDKQYGIASTWCNSYCRDAVALATVHSMWPQARGRRPQIVRVWARAWRGFSWEIPNSTVRP